MQAAKSQILPLSALALALSAGGCAHVATAVSTPDPWIELNSAHFRLRTNTPLETAQQTMRELERAHLIIQNIGFNYPKQPKSALSVVLFATEDQFQPFGMDAAGKKVPYFGRENADPEETPLVVAFGDLTESSRAILYGGLAQALIHYHYPAAPVWLREGLAEYFASMRIEGDSLKIGEHAQLGFTEADFYCVWEGRAQRCWIPFGRILPLRELFGMDRERFYATGADEGTPDSRWRTNRANAATAFSLVRYLETESPEMRKRFHEFLGRMQRGEPWEDAWGQAFADDPRVEEEFRASLIAKLYHFWIDRVRPLEDVTLKQRQLGPLELRLMYARLRNWNTEEGKKRALEDINAVLAEQPGSGEAQLLSVLVDVSGRDQEAIYQGLMRALGRLPEDQDLNLAVGQLALKRQMELPTDRRDWSTAESCVTRLRKKASTEIALQFIASYYAAREQPDAGLPFGRRAVDADPSSYESWSTYALLLFEKRLVKDALEAQDRAIAVAPDRRTSGIAKRVRETYASAAGTNPSSP